MDIYMMLQKHVDIWDIKPTSKHQNMDIYMTLQKHVDIWDIKPTSKHQNMDIHEYDITNMITQQHGCL